MILEILVNFLINFILMQLEGWGHPEETGALFAGKIQVAEFSFAFWAKLESCHVYRLFYFDFLIKSDKK